MRLVTALFFIEAWHAISHCLVLSGIFPFAWVSEWMRLVYFPGDLLSCIVSYVYLVFETDNPSLYKGHPLRSFWASTGSRVLYHGLCWVQWIVHLSTLVFWNSW